MNLPQSPFEPLSSAAGMPPSPVSESLRAQRPKPLEVLAYHGLRLFLGAVFLVASFDKILHPRAFAEAIYNYQILPGAAVNLVALGLPWLEALVGLCLLLGAFLPGATLTGTALMAVFLGALGINLYRGLDVHCGCFSATPEAGPAGVWTLARDAALLLASIALTVMVASRPKAAAAIGAVSGRRSPRGVPE